MTETKTGSKTNSAKALWDHVTQSYDQSDKQSIYLHSGLCLKFSDLTGAGVFVKEDVEPNTVLLTLPSSKQIKPDNCAIKDKLASLDSWCALIVSVLYEQCLGTRSQHYLFLESIPEHFDLPMFWSINQAIKLAGLSLPKLLDVESDWTLKVQPWLKQHQDAFACLQSSHSVDFAMYKRAVALILSRAFRDNLGNPCMLPVVDYVNTTPTKVADASVGPHVNAFVCWDDETGAANLISLRPIKQDSEVFIEYGVERGNAAYLQRYGFVISGQQNLEDTCLMDCESVAETAVEMGFTDNFPRPHKRSRQASEANGCDDDDDESDTEIEEFIESLPDEKIPLTFSESSDPSKSSGLPDRFLKLSSALCGFYPTEQLINHSDAPSSTQSLPMKMSDRDNIVSSRTTSNDPSSDESVQSAPLTLLPDQELMVLELCWLCLQERLAELTLVVDESEIDLSDQSMNDAVKSADVAQHDEHRATMTNVLRESEKAIVSQCIAQTMQRMDYLKHAMKRKSNKRKNPIRLMQ